MQQEIRVSMKLLMYDNENYHATGDSEVALTVPEKMITGGEATEMFKLAVSSMMNDAQYKMKKKELELEEEKEADENMPDLNEVERLMEDDPEEDR